MPRKKKTEPPQIKTEPTQIQLQVKIPLEIVRRWHVKLPHAPELVVEAATGEEAWAKYKERFGIIDSQWTVEVRETDESPSEASSDAPTA